MPAASTLLRPLLLALGLCAIATCSESGLELGQRPLVVGQLDSAMTFVEVGQTLAVEIDVTEVDGSAPVFRWIWDTAESDQYLLETSVTAGHLSVRFTPRVPGRVFLTGRIEIDRAGDETEVVGVAVGDVRAFGGAPSHPLPAHKKMHLMVGESRSTFAFPIAEGEGASSNRTLGGGAVHYTSEDEQVASVTQAGRVTAASVGSTRITMEYGSQSASIDVDVVEGQLSDPPLAPLAVDTDFAAIARRAATVSSAEGRMATNARGWPVIALVFDALAAEEEPSLGGQVVLAEWTGSGWGLELVSRPYDLADDALVAIDEGGTPYLMYSSRLVRSSALHGQDSSDERSYVLAGRAGPDGAWQHHALPHGQDADPDRDRLGDLGRARSLRVRSGGGVWAVYTSSGTRYSSTSDRLCVDQLLLAELRGSQLQMHEVVDRELSFALAGACPEIEATNIAGTDMMLDILPREGDAELPGILSAHPWKVDCQERDYVCALPVNRFDPSPEGYVGKNVLRDFDFAEASAGNLFSYLHLSAVRDPGSAEQPGSILVALEATEVTSPVTRTIVINSQGATWFESAPSDFTLGFRQDGYAYVGDPSLETLRVIGPDGLIGGKRNNPSSLGAQSNFDDSSVVGWTVFRQRLYLAQASDETGLVLHTSEMPMRSLALP